MSEYIDSPEAKVTLYEQLGVQIGSLKAQRDAVKAELIEDYLAGVVCSNGVKQVSYKSQSKLVFDWAKAHAAGDIPDDVFKKWSTPETVPYFRLVKVEAQEAPATDDLRANLAKAAASLTGPDVTHQVKA